jgi:hypothetical protein
MMSSAAQCNLKTVQIFAKQAQGDARGMTSCTEKYRDDFAPVCVLNVLLSGRILFDIIERQGDKTMDI